MLKAAIISFAIFALVACQSDDRDASGTPIKLAPVREKTLAEAIVWLPAPIIRNSTQYTQTMRDNQHPQERLFMSRSGSFFGQYLGGYYVFFSEQSALTIYDEDEFLRWAISKNLSGTELVDRHKFGYMGAPNGGWYALYKLGALPCIVARVGANMGPRAADRMPFDSIIDAKFCGTQDEVDEVLAFLKRPRRVTDRDAFKAHVEANS